MPPDPPSLAARTFGARDTCLVCSESLVTALNFVLALNHFSKCGRIDIDLTSLFLLFWAAHTFPSICQARKLSGLLIPPESFNESQL